MTALVPASAPDARDLPLASSWHAERDIGVFPVGVIATLVGLLAVLALLAGMVSGSPVWGVVAAAVAFGVLRALREDTRISTAHRSLARGDLERARALLDAVARSPRQSGSRRARACAMLAAIAWRRGDVDGALTWVQRARPEADDADAAFFVAVTEVQLLAMAGHVADARAALAGLPRAPEGVDAGLVEATVHMLVAFVSHDPELVTRPAADLWARAEAEDRVGVLTTLVAWWHEARGDRDLAFRWIERARSIADREHLRRFYPPLAAHLEERRSLPYAR